MTCRVYTVVSSLKCGRPVSSYSVVFSDVVMNLFTWSDVQYTQRAHIGHRQPTRNPATSHTTLQRYVGRYRGRQFGGVLISRPLPRQYFDFLPEMLNAVYAHVRRGFWFQHDRTPSHNARWLFGNHWIWSRRMITRFISYWLYSLHCSYDPRNKYSSIHSVMCVWAQFCTPPVMLVSHTLWFFCCVIKQ